LKKFEDLVTQQNIFLPFSHFKLFLDLVKIFGTQLVHLWRDSDNRTIRHNNSFETALYFNVINEL